MNWPRGFWRLWIATSVLWVAFWIWRRDLLCELQHTYFGTTWGCSDSYRTIPSGFVLDLAPDTLPLIFGMPLLILALGFLARWIANGFWPRQKSN